MESTFRYTADEVKAIALEHHEALWPTPKGYYWVAVSDTYGSPAVKVELLAEKAKE